MARKLKFDLNVQNNALLCPNPQEFYSKAYITEDIVDDYRTLPGIKYETKVANVLFTDILHASNCSFTSDTSPLDAIDIDVCAISAMAEICRFDLEQSFVSLQMAKGDQGSWDVPSFMAYYWDEMAKTINDSVAQLRWQGDVTGPTGAGEFLYLCDGYETKLCGVTAQLAGATAITGINQTNVLGALQTVYNALPGAVLAKKSDIRLYVASNVYAAYEYAAAVGNTLSYITQPLALTFLGVKVVHCPGMSNDTIVATLKNNLIYAFDGEGDTTALKAINMEDTVAEPLLRTRANIKVGFFFTNPQEISFNHSCV
jgi:hypothetical protein